MVKKFDVNIISLRKAYLDGEKLTRKISWECSRKIFVNDNYILKVDWKDRNYDQCKNEYNLWKEISKQDKKFFVPILQYFHCKQYDYVIQPRLKLAFHVNGKTPEQFWKKEMKKLLKKYNICDIEAYEFRNWAIFNGQPIIFDYGV